MSEVIVRRLFLQQCFSSALKLTFVSVMAESCGSNENKEKVIEKEVSDPCNDLSSLSKEDIQKRESLGYVKKAPTENKKCGNCNLWLPAVSEKECGRCQLFKGPVPAEGYCMYWAPQV